MGIFAGLNSGKPAGPDLGDMSVIAGRIDNLESGLLGVSELNSVSITGGSIDNIPIGAVAPVTVTANQATIDNIIIDGNTISSSTGDINITPNGTSKLITTSLQCTSIATGGNEALCFDILVSTVTTNSAGDFKATIPHLKGAKIRGALSPYLTVNNTSTQYTQQISITDTNVIVSGTSSLASTTYDIKVPIFYIP